MRWSFLGVRNTFLLSKEFENAGFVVTASGVLGNKAVMWEMGAPV